MQTDRPATLIILTETEQIELMRRAKMRKVPAEMRQRAEIILACAEG